MAQDPAREKVNLTTELRVSLVRTLLSIERTLTSWMHATVSLVAFGFTLYQAYCCFRYVKRTRSARRGPHV
jgi:uncharacterized membrane protein YidH (DUF202 family)